MFRQMAVASEGWDFIYKNNRALWETSLKKSGNNSLESLWGEGLRLLPFSTVFLKILAIILPLWYNIMDWY